MSVDAPMIEIREWGRPARRRSLNRPLLVGRDCAGELLADDGVSRQHLRLEPTPTALSVIDLGSRNGTTVNGLTLTRRTELAPGDIVRLGSSEIVVLRTPTKQRDFDATRSGLQVVSAPPPPPPPPCEVAPPRWTALAERILGIDPTNRRDMFPAFTDLTSRVPLRVWQALGAAAIAAYLATIVVMFVRPAAGQFVFFHVIVPLLPITFFTFFATYRRTTQVQQLEMAPTAFVAKLRARWEQQSAPRPRAAVGATGPSAPDAPTIFISYMREDADAARRLCNAITSLGGDVWLDERRLRPGDAWEHEILTHIRRTVRLFVPIISANTERAQEGYVFAEWREAVDRSRSIPRRRFIVPVIVDDDYEGDPSRYRQIPDDFGRLQFGRAPAGDPDAELLAMLTEEIRAMRRTMTRRDRRNGSQAARRPGHGLVRTVRPRQDVPAASGPVPVAARPQLSAGLRSLGAGGATTRLNEEPWMSGADLHGCSNVTVSEIVPRTCRSRNTVIG